MSEHTLGPWAVESAECSDGDTRWTQWAVTSAAGPICSEVFTEANARLLAAAPDMYAALRAMLNPDETERDVDMALEALHKAEGG